MRVDRHDQVARLDFSASGINGENCRVAIFGQGSYCNLVKFVADNLGLVTPCINRAPEARWILQLLRNLDIMAMKNGALFRAVGTVVNITQPHDCVFLTRCAAQAPHISAITHCYVHAGFVVRNHVGQPMQTALHR